MSDANKAVVRRYFEENLNQGTLALVDELFSTDSVIQVPHWPEMRGREARKELVASLHKAFPDLHYSIDELIAEEDKVVARWSFEGTHQGDYLGISPTGKKVSCGGTSTFRIADGMITAELVQWDALGMMQQLGAVPAT